MYQNSAPSLAWSGTVTGPNRNPETYTGLPLAFVRLPVRSCAMLHGILATSKRESMGKYYVAHFLQNSAEEARAFAKFGKFLLSLLRLRRFDATPGKGKSGQPGQHRAANRYCSTATVSVGLPFTSAHASCDFLQRRHLRIVTCGKHSPPHHDRRSAC